MSVRDLSCASAETWKDMGPIKNRMKAALEVAWGATAPPPDVNHTHVVHPSCESI